MEASLEYQLRLLSEFPYGSLPDAELRVISLEWQRVAASKARTRPRTPNLSFPEKFSRATNFCRQTFVHRTIERGLLKDFPLRMIGREGDVNF